MAKMVYWIDDSVQKLLHIMQGIITDLWNVYAEDENDKVMSKILLFGNEFLRVSEETGNTIQKEYELQKRLDLCFKNACSKHADVDWRRENYKMGRNLIEDCARVLFKQWTDQEADLFCGDEKDNAYQKRQEDLILLEEVKKYWIPENRDAMEEQMWKEGAPDKVKKLIELMNIQPGACVGIDLALLTNDRESIRYIDKPVIAMELYHQIKEKDYFCFLYSTYSYEKYLVPRCKEIYYSHYNDECSIYRREEMMIKGNYEKIADVIRKA